MLAKWSMGVLRKKDLKMRDKEKEDQGHSQQIKTNNYTFNFSDKKKGALNSILTAAEAWSRHSEYFTALLNFFTKCCL